MILANCPSCGCPADQAEMDDWEADPPMASGIFDCHCGLVWEWMGPHEKFNDWLMEEAMAAWALELDETTYEDAVRLWALQEKDAPETILREG